MGKDIQKRSSNRHYSLRQTIVFTKRLTDYEVEISTVGKSLCRESPSTLYTSCEQQLQDLLPVFANPGSSSSRDASSHLSSATRETNAGSLISNTVDSLSSKEKKGESTAASCEETDEEVISRRQRAAVCPDLLPLTEAPRFQLQSCTVNASLRDEPLQIHGYSISEYRNIHHAVVDPLLRTPAGDQRDCTLTLGRKIKQELWRRLSCPTLTAEAQADGLYHFTESFSSPGLKRKAPDLKLDISGEPKPRQPKKKARH